MPTEIVAIRTLDAKTIQESSLATPLATLLERCALVTAATDGPPSGQITADHVATLATTIATDVDALDALIAIIAEARRTAAEYDSATVAELTVAYQRCPTCHGEGSALGRTVCRTCLGAKVVRR